MTALHLVRWLQRGAILAILLGASLAVARPGGGHSSSGGSHSSSSSSRSSSRSYGSSSRTGSGSSNVSPGFVGITVGLGIVGLAVAAARNRRSADLNIGQISHRPMSISTPWRPLDLRPILLRDGEFSRAVFEDFAFQLYAAAHRHRGDDSLTPYLSDNAASQLAQRGLAPQQIVIGTLRIESVATAAPFVVPAVDKIRVRIEATLLLATTAVFAVETWTFVRSARAQSRPPVSTRTWPCPNCGAPWERAAARKCAHCGENVEVGRFDWAVEAIQVHSQEPALASLTGTIAEYGNDLATAIDPEASDLMAAIAADDPHVTAAALKARIQFVYGRLNQAWNSSDLTPARGLITGAMRGYLDYWLGEYERQKLRNYLDDAQIERVELAKVLRDKFFDAITVRVRADGCDYTLDGNGRLVGGSRTDRRAYTEYWTFLRASTRRGPLLTTPTCPNCGAPLEISDLGDCPHCNATVENGSFDWVLSKIEQDDTYVG